MKNLPNPKGKLFYLASPYSHTSPVTKEMRYVLIAHIGGALYRAGYNLLEPIAVSHPIAKMTKLPTGYEFWEERDRTMISRCDGVIVVTMKGYNESVGVKHEIEYANELGIPVYFLDPKEVLQEYPVEA